jgi:O-antigen ligase
MLPDSFLYYLLAVGILTLLIPIGYIYYFLIVELRRKFGYLKFSLILLGYIIFWVVITLLLSEDHISVATYILSPILLNLLCVYYLKQEFVNEIKQLFRVKSKSSLPADHENKH